MAFLFLFSPFVMLNLFQHPTCKVIHYAGYLACEIPKQVRDDVSRSIFNYHPNNKITSLVTFFAPSCLIFLSKSYFRFIN